MKFYRNVAYFEAFFFTIFMTNLGENIDDVFYPSEVPPILTSALIIVNVAFAIDTYREFMKNLYIYAGLTKPEPEDDE